MHRRFGIERFLNIRSAGGPSWSPDGARVAFLMNVTGTAQVWSVDRNGGWPMQLTYFEDRVMSAEFSPRDGRLLVHKDTGGNERAQLYLLSADGASCDLITDAPDAIHQGIWSPDGARIAFASNRRNPAYFDLYVASADGSEARCVLEHDGTHFPQAFSPDGRRLLFSRHEVALENGLHVVDLETGETRSLTGGDLGAAYLSPEWDKDGRGVFVVSDRDRDFRGLAWLDAETGELTWLFTPDWDVETLSLSPDGGKLALTVNAGGRSELYVRDNRTGELREIGVPQGVVYDLAWSPDSKALAFTLDGSARPMNVWIWEESQDAVRQLTFAPTGGVPPEVFVEAQLVSYESFDGLSVPAWFYLPKDVSTGKPRACIVYVHGGPESQSRASFNGVLQYFLHRGYAVLAPNVRGSTGYGKAYTHLDDVRKRMDSVADLAACISFLEESDGVDSRKVIVMGGSYGGFMTLAAVTHYPDLWAAAVDLVGIANLETFLENTGAYRRKLRECEYGSLEQDRDFFREISPIHHVDKIKAPLFVIHGANDPRVPVGEAEQIVEAVRKNGGIVEYLRFEDEGHGLVKLANRLKTYPAVADFLDRHVGVE